MKFFSPSMLPTLSEEELFLTFDIAVKLDAPEHIDDSGVRKTQRAYSLKLSPGLLDVLERLSETAKGRSLLYKYLKQADFELRMRS